jgi:hypothetical protein
MATRLDRGPPPARSKVSIERSSGRHWQTVAHSQTCCRVGFETQMDPWACRIAGCWGPLGATAGFSNFSGPALSEPSARRSTPRASHSFKVLLGETRGSIVPSRSSAPRSNATESRWWRFSAHVFFGSDFLVPLSCFPGLQRRRRGVAWPGRIA